MRRAGCRQAKTFKQGRVAHLFEGGQVDGPGHCQLGSGFRALQNGKVAGREGRRAGVMHAAAVRGLPNAPAVQSDLTLGAPRDTKPLLASVAPPPPPYGLSLSRGAAIAAGRRAHSGPGPNGQRRGMRPAVQGGQEAQGRDSRQDSSTDGPHADAETLRSP